MLITLLLLWLKNVPNAFSSKKKQTKQTAKIECCSMTCEAVEICVYKNKGCQLAKS